MNPVVTGQLVISGPVVLLSGPALLELTGYLERGIRSVRRDDACTPSPALLEVARRMRAAAALYSEMSMSNLGPDARTARPDAPSSTPDAEPAEVTPGQAAELIGITERHVRRVAHDIGTVRTAPLLLDRAGALAYAARRRERERKTR